MGNLLQRKALLPALLIVLGLLAPMVFQDSYVRHLFILAFIYAIVAASWDVTLGYAGIFNFAHMAFFGIGIYSAGLTAKLLGVNPWLAIFVGGLGAAIAAAIVALPIVRLKGVYVVLVTFAFSQLILQVVISQSDITGGTQGLLRVPTLTLPGYNFVRDQKLGYYYVALALLIASTVLLRLLVKSDFGLSIKALRDNEDYGVARGIPIAAQRLKALVASAFFAGVAGGFYVIYLRVASPEVFDMTTSSLVLSMVLVGGIASIYGPIGAAVMLTFISEGLANVDGLAEGRFILVALIMIAVLLFLPKGLASALPTLQRRRARRSSAVLKTAAGPR